MTWKYRIENKHKVLVEVSLITSTEHICQIYQYRLHEQLTGKRADI